MDPFNEHNDDDLWEALERAHLKDVILRNSFGLDAEVLKIKRKSSVSANIYLNSMSIKLLRVFKVNFNMYNVL